MSVPIFAKSWKSVPKKMKCMKCHLVRIVRNSCIRNSDLKQASKLIINFIVPVETLDSKFVELVSSLMVDFLLTVDSCDS